MEDEGGSIARRSSTRIRKIAPKMGEALSNADNRTQAILARLDALENDNAAVEVVDIDDDEDASLDEEEQVFTQKKHSRSSKRKTRQAKAVENAKKAPQTFMELLQEANLEATPPHVPTYLRAAVGPPSSTARRHFCSVCGYIAPYSCVQCSSRFCSVRCQRIHSDTRCLKFVA
ncbi:SWR1 complex subunit 6 [Cryptomeria japonica]|uniref:SWR1 complex subunit 6 n=1 Tax=Cryptomeria japonica TaxID=3369 RepID=UPI0025AD1E4C|nr:SWR1 complex subunit 6 [Cryptomeria japonica]